MPYKLFAIYFGMEFIQNLGTISTTHDSFCSFCSFWILLWVCIFVNVVQQRKTLYTLSNAHMYTIGTQLRYDNVFTKTLCALV